MRKLFFPTVIILLCTSAILFTACAAMIEASNPKTKSQGSTDITKYNWRLLSANLDNDIQPFYTANYGINATMKISPDGKISGHNGCNEYFGEVLIENNKFHIGKIMSSSRACYEDRAKTARVMMVALNNADNFVINGSYLTLKIGSKELATFISYK